MPYLLLLLGELNCSRCGHRHVDRLAKPAGEADRVLVMSMHDESLYADRVLRAGGRGYIRKQEGGDKLIDAMRRVLRGEIVVSEKMTGRLLEKFSGRTTMDSPLERLSDRERKYFD